jgi:hypothetical protein
MGSNGECYLSSGCPDCPVPELQKFRANELSTTALYTESQYAMQEGCLFTSSTELLMTQVQLKGISCKVKVKVILQSMVGLSVCLVSDIHLGPKTKFIPPSGRSGFVHGGDLSDERTGLQFTVDAGPYQRGLSWVGAPRDA